MSVKSNSIVTEMFLERSSSMTIKYNVFTVWYPRINIFLMCEVGEDRQTRKYAF